MIAHGEIDEEAIVADAEGHIAPPAVLQVSMVLTERTTDRADAQVQVLSARVE